MQKQLNQVEIDRIVQFLKENEVKHYDVQLEMIDHFATAIESDWEAYPADKDFKNRILSVSGSMRKKDFKKIVGEKMGIANRKGYKYAFSLVKQFLKLPQIIFSFLIVIYLFELLRDPAIQIGLFKMGLLIPPLMVFLVGSTTLLFNWVKNKKRLLILESNFMLFLLPNGLTTMVHALQANPDAFPENEWFLFSLAILIFIQVLFCIGLSVFTINAYGEIDKYFPKYS